MRFYTANDGKQGLIQFEKHSPQLVITDIKMPFMDGLQMCNEIRKISKDVKIIFLTAFGEIEYFQKAIDLQVDGYILKPIDISLLINKIETLSKQIYLEEELQLKQTMLIQQSKMASMGEMIGNIAHQWKQPLSIISMEVSNLLVMIDLKKTISEENITTCADDVLEQIQHLSQTIDDFKDFFKPSKQLKIFNLAKFIDKCLKLTSASFKDNTIEVIKQIDDSINSYGHPEYFVQALINILNNAKDALKNAQNIEEKLLLITTISQKEDKIIVVVRDNAGGIPLSIIDKVFDPYFTTKEKNEGTGLGLYISHNIVTQSLKGEIKVENVTFEHNTKTYKGAQFTITLPKVN